MLPTVKLTEVHRDTQRAHSRVVFGLNIGNQYSLINTPTSHTPGAVKTVPTAQIQVVVFFFVLHRSKKGSKTCLEKKNSRYLSFFPLS